MRIELAKDVVTNRGLTSTFTSGCKYVYRQYSPYEQLLSLSEGRIKIINRQEFQSYLKEDNESEIHYYSTEESFDINNPISPDKTPVRFGELIGTHKLQQPFFGIIPNGVIMKNGMASISDGTIILESLRARRPELGRKASLSEMRELYKYQSDIDSTNASSFDYEVACPLISAPIFSERESQSVGAGHSNWLTNILPRFEAIQHYEKMYDEKPHILIASGYQPVVYDMIKSIGFDTNRVIEWSHGDELRIKRMIVPSVRRAENDAQHRKYYSEVSANYKLTSVEGLKWVRKETQKNIESLNQANWPERVFISREDAGSRRIINRGNVEELLSDHQFETFVLSELSWEDQVNLFSQAKFIVGAHGAGLINMIFSERPKILELLGPKLWPRYHLLANQLENPYGMLLCETRDSDIYVNTSKLEKLLNKMMEL